MNISCITKLEIKNFHSIKNKIVVDMTGSEYTNIQHPERIFKFNENIYNKLVAIYGANASGKTSILKAISLIAHVITNESKDKFPVSHKNIYTNANNDTHIKIEFIVNNNYFIYEVFFQTKKDRNVGIKNEILKQKINARNITLLNRQKKVLKDKNFKNIDILFEKIHSSISLVKEALTRDETNLYKMIEKFFSAITLSTNITGVNTTNFDITNRDFFTLGLMFSDLSDKPYILEQLEVDDENDDVIHNLDFIDFSKKFLDTIGIDINEFKSKINFKDDDDTLEINIMTYHKFNLKKPLDFHSESDGTKMLIDMLLKIFLVKASKSVLIIDEFDSILHPIVVPILNHLIIKSNIQVIYTTHNVYNMKYLYCDEVYLIEKNDDHETLLKRVQDQNNINCYDNVELLYENEVLGGLPKINMSSGLFE